MVPESDQFDLEDDLLGVEGASGAPSLSRPVRLARRKRWATESNEESEEWVISYMDMVTLIMCAFVVIAALLDIQSTHSTGQFLPEQQEQPISPVLAAIVDTPAQRREGYEEPPSPPQTSTAPANQAEPPQAAGGESSPRLSMLSEEQEARATAEIEADARTEQIWRNALETQGLGDRVSIQAKGRTVTMQIQDEILFPVGDGDLGAGGQVVIRKLTPLLAQAGGEIHVEGHTDNVPIANDRFASNWELSTTRASSVVRAFIAAGIDPHRLRATGFADTRPVQSNDSESGRGHNRRVSLIIER